MTMTTWHEHFEDARELTTIACTVAGKKPTRRWRNGRGTLCFERFENDKNENLQKLWHYIEHFWDAVAGWRRTLCFGKLGQKQPRTLCFEEHHGWHVMRTLCCGHCEDVVFSVRMEQLLMLLLIEDGRWWVMGARNNREEN